MAYKKKDRKGAVKQQGRRRLQPAPIGRKYAFRGSAPSEPAIPTVRYPTRKQWNRINWKTKQRTNMRVETSDNITSLKAITIGKPVKPTFAEKVARINNPPVIYKRNYSWSAECTSGRKGWFQIPINHFDTAYSGGSLYDDAIASFARLNTNTVTVDPTIIAGGQATQQRAYIDYFSQFLRMVNSGTNSITGTINLVAYSRDCDSLFANQSVPMTPINLMMFSSTNNLHANAPGQEATVGNGWAFDNVTSGVNYIANYVMPGSTVNVGGATAQTDPHLTLFSSHIKQFMGYFMRSVSKTNFSLKPGQQVNQFLKIHDSPLIKRESLEYLYLKGITFFLVVEFEAGVVGSSTAANVISTGSGQLSCILEEKRMVGLSGRLKSKLVMPTAPLTGIAAANQQTINPDTGIVDVGYDDDL